MALNRQQIKNMIEACYQAELEVLEGKTVTLNGRTLSMESLGEIRRSRQEYERKLKSLSRAGSPSYKVARFS